MFFKNGTSYSALFIFSRMYRRRGKINWAKIFAVSASSIFSWKYFRVALVISAHYLVIINERYLYSQKNFCSTPENREKHESFKTM